MTQPEALRLADRLMEPVVLDKHAMQAAAELRRLHSENETKSEAIQRLWKERDELRVQRDELLKALKELKHVMPIFPKGGNNLIGYKERYNSAKYQASQAIAKAEKKT